MQIRLMQGKIALGAVMLAGLLAIPTLAQQAQQESPWKDTAEYELVMNGIAKEANPQKKLQLLQQWQEKYPDSKLKPNRLQMFLQTYQALGNAPAMKKTASEMVASDSQGIMGLFGAKTLNLLVVSMNDKSETALADGEKAANSLLGMIDQVKKPDQVAEDVWAKEKTDNQALAHRTLGWVAWQRKNFTEAESQFVQSLKINPGNGEVASWLGTVILLQRSPDKQASGLYQFARSGVYDGPGALPDAQRSQAKAYFEKTYVNFHGSTDGMAEIEARAKTEPFPAEGFTIQSKAQLQAQDRDKLKTENPQLYLWLNLKDNLKGPDGEKNFEGMKGSDAGLGQSNISGFKGKLISQTPETNPKEIQLSIEDGITPDVTIQFEEALKGKADAGIELEFKGEVQSFTKDPYTLTFKANTSDIKGWPVQKNAPAKKAPARRAAPKKK